jgi:hypothetical protein
MTLSIPSTIHTHTKKNATSDPRSYDRFHDSVYQKVIMGVFLKFPWVFFNAKFQTRARFRLFVHTKRDIVVAGCTSGETVSTRGNGLSPMGGRKVFPRRTKKVRRSCDPKKITPLGIEPTTYGYNFNPTVTFHGGAGRLSRRIGYIYLNPGPRTLHPTH